MERRLRVEMHPEFGTLGLTPLWMPGHQSDPLTGMGVAHDVLEHGKADVCEWQGLGGAVLVRASQGYFQRGRGNPDAAENIGSDFRELFYLWEGQDIPDPGRTRPVDDDELIQECVNTGCTMLLSEFDSDSDTDQRRAALLWTRTAQRERMVGWMRRGYRAAQRRYKGRQLAEVEQTFRAIEQEVDRFLDGRTEHEPFEGLEVVLHVNVRQCTARLEVEEDPYAELE